MTSFAVWKEVLTSCGILDSQVTPLAVAFASNGVREGNSREERHREKNRQRNRQYALEEMDAMGEKDFKKMFRLSKSSFWVLHGIVADDLDDHSRLHALNSSGSVISSVTRLACTLRWLAGGSYLDICFEFGIGHGTFYQDDGILWGTIVLIDDAFEIGMPVHDADKLDEIQRLFSRECGGVLNNCVMAMDGWVCRTRQPYRNEVESPMHYRNRHECYGLVVLAGCDAQKRFMMLSCKNTGSTHDSQAWDMSEMKAALDDNQLPNKYYMQCEKFQSILLASLRNAGGENT